ncbi:MAG: hypothetical protein V4864_08435 [Pseudomonadota bacterium]
MQLRHSFPAVALATAVLLSACGGGGDFENDPRSSGRPAALAVTAAGDTQLNGTYTTADLQLNDVVKFNPVGGDPETCRFHFSALPQAGSTRVMDGDLRYLPGTSALRVSFIAVDAIEFRLDGTTNAVVDRVNNVVTFNNAVFTSTQGTGRTVTLTGTLPYRGENKPEGC